MLKIYGLPFSAHSRKVIVGARFKGLEYELVPTIPFKPTPEFEAASPLRLLPAIEHGDIKLADSSVIALYLDRVYPDTPLYPAAPADYARALWIEELVDGALAKHVLHDLLMQRVFGPKFLGIEPDQALIRAALEQHIPARLAYLEGALGEAQWFAGSALSYADITVASILINLHYAGERVEASTYPRLFAFIRRALATPCFAGALELEAAAVSDVPELDLWLLQQLGLR